MLRISADGVDIFGRPLEVHPRAEGLFVGPGGFNGWDDGGGEVRREAVPRPAAIGEFDMPVYEGAMVFSVDGHALAYDPPTLGHLRDRVTGLGYGGRRFRVVVEHQERELWTWCRRGARPKFDDAGIRHGLHRGEFLLQFVAPIPRKYGEARDFAAGETAFHRGNESAVPLLLIGAGAGGYTVTGPGGRVVTVSTAPAGAHQIDFATGGLFLNGVRQVGALSVYQPWSVPPGLPGVTATISGARTLTQRVTDTYA